jgi:hypothetical protein
MRRMNNGNVGSQKAIDIRISYGVREGGSYVMKQEKVA